MDGHFPGAGLEYLAFDPQDVQMCIRDRYLHLYPNAVQPDSLQIGQVTLSGVAAFHEVSADGTLLRVPLVNELLPGESVRLYLDFSFTLPRDCLLYTSRCV